MHPSTQPTRTVMVVDDDYAIREMLTEALEDAGYHVMSAENGKQALAQLRQAAVLPRVILLDLMMPIMTGWEFCAAQQADAHLAAIPVIMLSARSGLHQERLTVTVDDYIQKPLDIPHLLALLERYCV